MIALPKTVEALRRRQSAQSFLAFWHEAGNVLRMDRDLQATKRTVYGLARDEVWPLVRFLQHFEADEAVEFEFCASGTPGKDARVYFSSGAREFEIKTTAPLWPRRDGTLANYGKARREFIRSLGTGVSNFGPRQADLLGEEYGDPEDMIPKRRLVRAGVIGLRDAFNKTRASYTRPSRSRTGIAGELIVYLWGIEGRFVSRNEFIAMVRLAARCAPLELFRAVHVVGAEGGHYVALRSN